MKTIKAGPWRVASGSTVYEPLTREQVLALRAAMPDKQKMLGVLGCTHLTERRMDRALQLLRSADLAIYNRETKTWEAVGEP